jgi:polysaccharide deacetylase family protein (PEP-CTERM system associated)
VECQLKLLVIESKGAFKMKTVFLTIDIEEWYHLDYLKKYGLNNNSVETVPKIFDFLDMLDKLNIKATFFVLAELACKYADIIRDIRDRGHEIGCHGLDHELLYNKSDQEFENEVIEAKAIINRILDEDMVKGYRASCFSMDRKKLDILKKCGYTFDSSYIKFAQHPLYGHLDLGGYKKVDDLIYENDGFYEFEIPTIEIGNIYLPISGGGYLRLFPYLLTKLLLNKYSAEHENFLLYIHPFELTNIKLPLSKEISFKDKFRASVGRKRNLEKIEKLLTKLIKDGVEFKTMGQVIDSFYFERGINE